MSLHLKQAMADAGITQGALARAGGLSRSALNVFINRGVLPVQVDADQVRQQIRDYVTHHGGSAADLFEPNDDPKEDIDMLLRKQSLSAEARRHFHLTRDPFAEPIEQDDVFLSPDIRYVREAMYQVARHGGFLGIIGESGAGKTTLREELIDRLQRDEQSVIVVQPYVLASEGTDNVGKTLRSHHIAEAIMAAVAPLAKPKSSPEARFRQLHECLRDSARAGHAHVLIIEEAHALPLPTLKHLKRYRELKDGLRPLLSVVLIGQPELALKLSEHNPEVREVVQRIELVNLPALDKDLDAYLNHRFTRAGTKLDQVMEPKALDALRAKLTPTRASGTLLYPLAVHNALADAMNRTVAMCAPRVTADIIRAA